MCSEVGNVGKLIGRTEELARLRAAILARSSLLVCGRAGAGKTALMEEAISGLPPLTRRKCVVCNTSENPRAIWRHLIRSLAERDDPQVMMRVQQECGRADGLDRWLNEQSSLRLRGILRRAMRANEYWVFFDTAAPLPDGVYRLLQEWVWSRRTPVILLGRGSTEQQLGKVARLFWHSGLRLELGAMRPTDLETLLECSIVRLNLTELADSEFRNFLLEHAAGLPGRIVRLCELASQSAYQWHGQIKLHMLAVDFLMEDADGPRGLRRANHHA